MTATDRYTKQWITLPDGRSVYGRMPGRSSVTLVEHLLRDDLARQIRGVTEAVLPYGRPDVLTADAVFEVEPATNWRGGVRQVLAYAAQTGLPPHVALFGEAHSTHVVKLYLKLRDGRPPITLWWYSGLKWTKINSRRRCTNMPSVPQRFDVTR